MDELRISKESMDFLEGFSKFSGCTINDAISCVLELGIQKIKEDMGKSNI